MPTILPFTFPPAGYFSAAPTQGSAINCFIPSDTRCFSLSNFRMMTSTSCSGFTTSEGCFTRPQLKSVKCSKPSIPPRSTNAPYSVTFFTWPCTTWPSLSVSINCARLACNSSSSSARRLTTTLPRRRFNLVMRTWISVPVRLSRFCTGLRAWNFRVREFRRRYQAFRLSAQVHHHAMFRVGDNLDLDHLVRRSRFLLLVVLLQQLAHLFRAGCFFIGGSRFGVRCVRLAVCFGSGVSSRGIGRRTGLLGRRGRRRPLPRACRLGMHNFRRRSSLLRRASYR